MILSALEKNGLSPGDFKQKIRPWILRAIFSLPFLVYCLFIFRDISNVPQSDDFDTILVFLIDFTHLNTVQEKAFILFAQHNEHRIVFSRVIVLIYYYLFRQIDFRSLIIFGNIGWLLVTASFLFYSQKILNVDSIYLLPIPYLAFSFVQSENMFFASAAIVFYWSIVFSLAFLYFLMKEKTFLYCFFFVVTLFTSGGGLVLCPIGMVYLFIQRKWKALAGFGIISAVCIAFYFYCYVPPSSSPGILASILNPLRTFGYFLNFLGSPFSIWNLSLPAGVLVLALSGFYICSKGSDPFLRLIMVFVVTTAILNALTRSGFGVAYAASSRYSVYSILLCLCIYLSVINAYAKNRSLQKFAIFATVFFALLWGTSVATYVIRYEKIVTGRTHSIVFAFTRKQRVDELFLLYPNPERAKELLITAAQLHIYDYRTQLPK